MLLQDFYEGKAFDAYTYFGAHLQGQGCLFRTYAPQASRVCVIGEFNNWQEAELSQEDYGGIWSIYSENAMEGQMYKYVIYGKNGRVEHCDPYGFGMELRPGSASIIRNVAYSFHDQEWMEKRTRNFDKALNIYEVHFYEVHFGSWRLKADGSWFTYDELAPALIDYCKKYHYTHVEFMPLNEYPFDGSWGYQPTGYFSPTSRYGNASQLQTLIDSLHQAGIGAIIDFVPAHFAVDSYGLKQYDGSELYEYPESDVTESEWGTCNFIYSRHEVCSFLQSVCHYWLQEYHFDGIRMDAVSRLIYWLGDEKRGVNPRSIEFIQRMNAGLHHLHPSCMLIAEDSTAYPNVTKPVLEGGLEFDYKWDLGWMNDTLDYFMKTSDERKDYAAKLTFSMYYFYKERYLLPLSHDEVVHGKKTIIDKIYGSYEEKFSQCRSLYMYMMVHPGKKLNFMGNEIAMFREWDESKEPDWFLLEYPMHDSFSKYIQQLNAIYTNYAPLYEWDDDPRGFTWVLMEEQENLFGIKRSVNNESGIYAYFNFSDQNKTIPLPEPLTPLLHSDWEAFSGHTKQVQKASKELVLPPFSSALLKV